MSPPRVSLYLHWPCRQLTGALSSVHNWWYLEVEVGKLEFIAQIIISSFLSYWPSLAGSDLHLHNPLHVGIVKQGRHEIDNKPDCVVFCSGVHIFVLAQLCEKKMKRNMFLMLWKEVNYLFSWYRKHFLPFVYCQGTTTSRAHLTEGARRTKGRKTEKYEKTDFLMYIHVQDNFIQYNFPDKIQPLIQTD